MKFNFSKANYAACGLLLILMGGLSHSAKAQSAAPALQVNAPVTADENFELNITERRITEQLYERSTSVTTGEARDENGVTVDVGAAVQAERVEILLRGITGRVRFRASLEALRQRIERTLQTTRPTSPAP